MRVLALLIAFSSFGLEPSFGADLREPASLGFDPLSVSSIQPRVDKMSGYREMKKLIMGKGSRFLQESLGTSYWTEEIAPIVLDSLYSSVEADASGHLKMRGPSSLLDDTANRLAFTGKKELSTFSKENFPELPVVGNLVQDLAESQNLSLHRGSFRYRMKMRKRLAPEFRIGEFSISGGTEAYIDGLDFSRKSVASIGYEGLDSSYQVQLRGRNVRFNVNFSAVDLRLDWNSNAVKFNLNLNVGSWL
jgi:hypothetical protein